MLFNLTSYIRGQLYWLLDRLTGSRVSKACVELAYYEQIDINGQELVRHQSEALNRLLQHATTTTDYYSSFKSHNLKLDNFPVTNKELIRSQQDRFLSSLYDPNKLFTMSTSGSTGTPFTCYQDQGKKRRVNAEVIHYSKKAGYRVGKRLINLRAAGGVKSKDLLKRWLQNMIVIDVDKVDEEGIEKLLDKLASASKGGAMLLAYASTYDALSSFFRKNDYEHDCEIYGMISSSELLFDQAREEVEKVFDCRCYSRYSNQENGIIGQDDRENNAFIINDTHYIIEMLELESDRPVEEGELGRIVITDLYNYAMPMIRYDTGDVGRLTEVRVNGIRKKALSGFQGRKIDLVNDSQGQLLSPHQVSVTLRNFKEVLQFQFIQEGQAEYLVRLKVDGAFSLESELKQRLKELLGDKAKIRFEYPAEIPTLESGKRNYIINQMAKG